MHFQNYHCRRKVDETNATVTGERIQAKQTVPARQFANIVLVDRMEWNTGRLLFQSIAGVVEMLTLRKGPHYWDSRKFKRLLHRGCQSPFGKVIRDVPKSRSMTILTAENITSRRVLRQILLDSEGYEEMEWELIRRGLPQALLS